MWPKNWLRPPFDPELVKLILAEYRKNKNRSYREAKIGNTNGRGNRGKSRPDLLGNKYRLGKEPWNKGTGRYKKQFIRGWSELSTRVRNRDRNICRKCGSDKYLNVHHKDIDRGNNRMSNLITLCASCHVRLHGVLRRKLKVA